MSQAQDHRPCWFVAELCVQGWAQRSVARGCILTLCLLDMDSLTRMLSVCGDRSVASVVLTVHLPVSASTPHLTYARRGRWRHIRSRVCLSARLRFHLVNPVASVCTLARFKYLNRSCR